MSKTQRINDVTQTAPERTLDLPYLVSALVKYKASDLHLRANRPPLFRINGRLLPASLPSLNGEQIRGLLYSVVTPQEIELLEKNRQVDFSFEIAELGRFRCNVFFTSGSLAAAIRMIPFNVPSMDQLGVPAVMKELVLKPRGLILVTGATGSGKSTTLASIVQYINETQRVHILTCEDPIEFVYESKKATITQREVGADVQSFSDALKGGLRQDPDVIVIGEMRDFVTIQAAITAAETGHLVISTLHTNDARSTVDRIVEVFPDESKNQIRMQLASSLVGVQSQMLVPRADGKGRVLASEVMVKSPSIEQMIRRGEYEAIPQMIEASETYYHMQSMNQALERLIKSSWVTEDEGLAHSQNPDDLRLRLSGIARQSG